MRVGTHGDLYSGPKVAVLHAKTTDEGFHAQNDRFCLGLLVTCYSGPKVAVLHAKKNT